MRLIPVLIAVLFWPASGVGQEPEITDLEPIGGWHRLIQYSPLFEEPSCLAYLVNVSGGSLSIKNGFPIFLAEMPDQILSSRSAYRYDKEQAETVNDTIYDSKAIIPSRLGTAKSLLVAFDVYREGFHYETFDLSDGQKILDWFKGTSKNW